MYEVFLKSQFLISSQRASLVAQMVKNLPAMWETGVWSPGRESKEYKARSYTAPVFLNDGR